MRGALVTNDSAQFLNVEFRVEHGAREVLHGRVLEALGIGQEVGKRAVELGVQWQLVKDEMIDAAKFVTLVEMKSFGDEHKVNFSMVEHVSRPIHGLIIRISKRENTQFIWIKQVLKSESKKT